MPIIGRLVELYKGEGIEICTGLGPTDYYDMPSATFTRFIKNGRSMTNGLGIALQEIYFLENLFNTYKPANVFIIGNSLGWSTLAIGLLLPDSNVIAMDAGFDENTLHGLELTNRLAAKAGLKKLKAVQGISPQDVARVADAELGGQIDFVFIDGLHTNEQVVLDYRAVAAKASADIVYLFHDVHAANLYDGLERIEALAGRKPQSLRATPSGMMILYDPTRHPELARDIQAFAPTLDARKLVKTESRRQRYVRLAKRELKRVPGFMESLNALCRLAGVKTFPLSREI